MPRRQRAASFENYVSPEIAANYRRLRRDKRVTEVIGTIEARFTLWTRLLRGVLSYTALYTAGQLRTMVTLRDTSLANDQSWRKSDPILPRRE
jgi:hypothetical protein